MTKSVVVIGGGIGGATAALRMAEAGCTVTLVDGADALGGLVLSFEVGGTPLERFYHHIFPQEKTIQALIDDLGLSERLAWLPSTMGILTGDTVWPFVSPQDLLGFKPLPLADRIRTGIGALRMAAERDWRALDRKPAVEWLTEHTGPAATEVLWKPMLRSKFGPAWPTVPATFMWGRFDQRRGARKGTTERLGYLRGGFAQIFDRLAKRLADAGVEVLLSTKVTDLVLTGERLTGVTTDKGRLDSDAVLWTGGLPGLSRLVPEALADPRWTATAKLGVLSVILELDRPLTQTYWTNICDASAPYGAIIEHTNFVPADDYAGRHVVYLARYHTDEEAVATSDSEHTADEWLADLVKRFPGFRAEHVLARHVFRAPYAAPLISLGHASRIPPMRSHLAGLYVATTAQIYPHDRGMNDGIELAAQATDLLLHDLDRSGAQWRCPVCGGTESVSAFSSSTTGSECGVTGEVFRPASDSFGATAGTVVRCSRCGHGSLRDLPADEAVSAAYGDAADPVTLRERDGQVETARRALTLIERYAPPGRLLDIGCWTGSFLLAARERGWQTVGVEPSRWAAAQAQVEGLDVRLGQLDEVSLPAASFDCVVACDVLEHLADPGAALARMHRLLAPGGSLFLTVPDAGSRLARLMGRRWWSVMPMHVQYFTRNSMRLLLEQSGFEVLLQDTHAKVFTAGYYAERLSGYSPQLSGTLLRLLRTSGRVGRPVAPDFHDRLQIVARAGRR